MSYPDLADGLVPEDFAGTFVESLPPDLVALLLAGAMLLVRKPGHLIFDVGDPLARLGLLLSGTTRSFLRAADGRQLTVRYSRRGSLVGKSSDLSGDHAPLSVEAVTPCRVLELDTDNVIGLLGTDVAIGRVVVNELTGRLEDVYATVADSVFGSMRQRLVRHLMAMADDVTQARTHVRATQQQLADGIGTSREVVARMLGALRSEGLIRTSPGAIEILDVRTLASFLGEWRTEEHRIEQDLFFDAERLLEASPNAVVAVDSSGSIVFANSTVERVFGWPRQDLIGLGIEVLVPERTRAVHAGLRTVFQEAPVPRPMGLGRELRGRRRDGTEFPLAASLTTIDTRDGALVIATIVELARAPEPSQEPALTV